MRTAVLVACPTYEKHAGIIDSYVAQFMEFTFPQKHLLLVENSIEDDDRYYKSLKNKFSKNRQITILRGTWMKNAMERLSFARNVIRHFASNYGFSHILFLDTDTFIPKDSIERLLLHEKDLVGFPCFSKNRKGNMQLIAMKSPNLMIVKDPVTSESTKTLDYYKSDEIMSQSPNLAKVYASAISPLLVSRKVFEKTPFRYIPTHPFGEDVGWHIENNDNGFEYYLDTSIIADHRKIENIWDGVEK